ncbi:38922_t:CDS:2, partial [Gigaspora margarita]
MPHDPILTHLKVYKDSLSSSEEQESNNEQLDFEHEFDNNKQEFDDDELKSDYFNEFEISQNIENSNRLDNFEEAQEIENSDIEMHNNLSYLSCKVALTTDIWSSCAMISYMAVTCHFINDNWQLCHILLDIFEIPSPHTGQTISNMLLLLLNKYKLENKILALTSDNASNIILASNLVKSTLANNYSNTLFQHVHCAAHIMNLAVKKSVLLIEDLKCIATSFDHSFLYPIIDCKTRWNSTFIIIDRALVLYIDLDTLIIHHSALHSLQLSNNECLRNHLDMFDSTYSDINLVAFVYFEQSVDEILAPIRSYLSTNSDNIIQSLPTLKQLQFIHEYAGISMPIANSNPDELIQYWETIAPPEEVSICD